MITRFSSLAALVVTFASLALGGCAADSAGPSGDESSISGGEAADVNAEETADTTAEWTTDLVVTVTPDFPEQALAPAHRGSELARFPERAVAPAFAGPRKAVDVPDLVTR
jgi:hypothetical protein